MEKVSFESAVEQRWNDE